MAAVIGVKKSIVDIWPIRNKRFLVVVDPNLLADETAKVQTSSIATIAQLVAGKGKVVVAMSFGDFPGTDLKMASHQRRAVVERWREEDGFALSHFFAALDGKQKVETLKKAVELGAPAPKEALSANRGTGKTKFFASLDKDLKLKILNTCFPAASFKSNTTLPFVELIKTAVPAAASVTFAEDPATAVDAAKALKPSEVLVLENLRFYSAETSANFDERQTFATILAAYGDVFVNDSFSTAHMHLASTEHVPRLLRHGAAGVVMERELNYFRRLVTHPARPTCCVLGGGRVAEKLVLLRSLLRKVDKVLLAGAVAMPFIAARGKSPGEGFDASAQLKWSATDRESINIKVFAKRLLDEAEALNVKIVLPVDFVTHSEVKFTKTPHVTQTGSVPKDLYAVDVGPNTVALFAREVRDCRTVFWVGTLGHTQEGFVEGTEAFARVVASANLVSVIGGDRTAEIVAASGCAPNISHICTGSVAQLHVLEGLALPGIAALTDVQVESSQQSSAAVNELLRHLPLFANCSAQQLSTIARKAIRCSHNAGDFIIYDGDRTTAMHVVAKGALVACPNAAFGQSIAQRFVEKGHAVGQYEFIAQRPCLETVRVLEQDTVTFRLPSSGLQEACEELPGLAEQLLANLADPLRSQQQRVHEEEASETHALLADCALMRKPIPLPDPRGSLRFAGSWKVHLLATLASTAALYPVFSETFAPFKSGPSTCVLARSRNGLYMKLVHDFTRELLCRHLGKARYHDGHHGIPTCIDSTPITAAIVSAIAATPLKLAATGVAFNEMTLTQLVDNGLLNGAMALAPVASHALFIRCRSRAQVAAHKSHADRHQHSPLPIANEVFIAIVCRAVVAIGLYPLVVRRSPAALSFRALLLYLLKHALSLLIEVVANKTLRPVAALIPL